MNEDLLKYVAREEDDGLKVDTILRNKLNLSRRMIIGMKKSDRIFLNGKNVLVNARVKKGDEVSVNIKKDESQDIEPEDMPLNILFEDKDLLVVDKQPGIVVHPTKGHPTGTLSNGVINHFRKNGEDAIVRLVNRLDRDTSGLIIIAKNQFSHQAMAKQLEANLVDKIYYAVVHGNMEAREGRIDLPIGRPSRESIKRMVMEDGQRAITHYEVVESLCSASLVKIKLETGKTHQIRVHMSHIGHPIFGDTLYGDYDDSKLIDRQALHAHILVFNHPRTNERLTIKAELPQDIISLIEKLKNTAA